MYFDNGVVSDQFVSLMFTLLWARHGFLCLVAPFDLKLIVGAIASLGIS